MKSDLPESVGANGELKCIIKFIINFPSSKLHHHHVVESGTKGRTQFRWSKLNYDDAMTRTVRPNTVEVN